MTAWTMYDWANSVYSLSISSAIFPTFYESFTPKHIEVMGMDFKNTALYSYCLSFAFLINVLLVPLLSGISDASGAKKPFMRFFVILGSLGCSALYFFNGHNYTFGLISFMIATLGFAGSLVFYNAYLPEIATPDKFDKLSARGFTMGYIGSVLMLINQTRLVWIAFAKNKPPALSSGFRNSWNLVVGMVVLAPVKTPR